MSIKSEKAKIHIASITGRVLKVSTLECIAIRDAEKAVELAESDAEQRCRERAVRAFQATCDNYENGNCELWYGVESERKCPGEAGCASVDKFLKHYDNE